MSGIDPTDIREQEAVGQKRKERARHAEELEIADLKWLMGGQRGRRIMWALLERCRVYSLSFAAGSSDFTAFNEGQRNIGLQYVNMIHAHCPERYTEMITDRAEKKANDDNQ